MFGRKKNPQPVHVKGIHKGEEMVFHDGRESGRGEGKDYRSPRDATSINPDRQKPIHPAMPNIPPT